MNALLARAYDLAARFPELGITPYLAVMTMMELSGVIAYLLRLAGERLANGGT